MKAKLSICCVLLLIPNLHAAEPASGPAADGTQPPESQKIIKKFPHEGSDLAPDAQAAWGRLDNGLRYVILPNREQPGRASLRLYMDVGSVMEEKDQIGMAHFLEHMAFNGTRRFAATETVEYFQRLGMRFGAHTNALTSFNATIYKLELPRANEELTADGLKFLRDLLDGMLLDEREIEKERRVITSEIRAKDSEDYRTIFAGMKFALPQSVIPRRPPVGFEPSVMALKRSRFVDFYETWYTPGRATIVAVGDFKPEMVEALIERTFRDAQAARGEAAAPRLGKVSAGQGLTARLHTEKNAAVTGIDLQIVRPAGGGADNAARRRELALRDVANAMLTARLTALASTPGAAVRSARASRADLFEFVELTCLSGSCEPGQWMTAVGLMEQELRRAMTHGFSEAELAEAKIEALKNAQGLAEQADTRQPDALADAVIESLAAKRVFTHPAEELALVKGVLESATPKDCLEALRHAWDSQDIQIFVHGNLELEGDAAEQILSAYRLSQWVPVRAPKDATASTFAYTDFGPPGEIVKQSAQEDLEVVQATFANHVRVNVKQTPFQKNFVQFRISVGGGALEAPLDKPGLIPFTNLTFIGAGLEAHNLADINRAVAGKNAAVNFSVGEDAFQFSGQSSTKDLETALQMAAAYITAPGYRPEAELQLKSGLDGLYNQLEHTAEGLLTCQVDPFLHSGDPRFGFPAKEAIGKLTLDDVKTWLTQPLREGYMEVAIVGDVDPKEALELVAKTLGALPTRAAAKPAYFKERQVALPAPQAKEFRFTSQTPKALALICWPTADGRDVGQDRRLNVLSAVLGDRLRVKLREELGATYSPQVMSECSATYHGLGFLGALITVDPEQLAEMGPLVTSIAAELATGTIGDDEFQRALQPALADVEQGMRTNEYWLEQLSNCQHRPEELDFVRSRVADYAAVTKAELEALARQYLGAERAFTIGLRPEAPAE